jgi:RNA polymerase primary sigma factor
VFEQPQEGNADQIVRLLIDHGRRKQGVTRNDIIDLLPDAEFQDELVQQIRVTVEAAGVPFIDEPGIEVPEDLSLEEVEFPETEDLLSGIDVDDMVRLYMREASQVPLLSAAEEVQLARLIEDCRDAQQKKAQSSGDLADIEELDRKIEAGREARERLIRANTRLVISVARKYVGHGLPFLDLIQEGNIGLMRSVRNFDYHRGFRFSTYATWWIRQAISRALADQSRTIRLPAYMSDQVNRVVREQQRLQHSLGRPPTLAELSETLGIPTERVQQLQEMIRQPISLQTPVGDEDEELGSVIQDEFSLSPEETVFKGLDDEDIRRQLDELPQRENQVLRLRYGVEGEGPMTLTEVGKRMGITRERVRQLENQALKRLRNPNVRRRRPNR